MINTIHTKKGLFEGVFHVGSDSPEQTVLMLGSCRGVPHLNFLKALNEANGTPWRIYYIDPFDLNWDMAGNRVDFEAAMARAAADERILAVIRSATIFVHEHYRNFGMFNTDRSAPGNIYDHGMSAEVDVSLPNFHDRFILFQNILDFTPALKQEARESGMGSVSERLREMGLEAMAAFTEMCERTSFPEFAQYFEDTRLVKRLFWNHNHVSHGFTIPLFRMLNERFLHLPADPSFYESLWNTKDLYSNANVCPLTQWDVDAHGWAWPEPLQEIKL